MAAQGGKRKRAEAPDGGDKRKRSWHQTARSAAASPASQLTATAEPLTLVQNAKAGLPMGTQGFLVSYVNGRDKQAVQEAEALLKEVRLHLLNCSLPTACLG